MEKVKNWILAGVIACLIILAPYVVSLNSAYIDLRVKVATIDAAQLKADDLKNLREDIRHAIKDSLASVESRIASDEQRISNLEVRK